MSRYYLGYEGHSKKGSPFSVIEWEEGSKDCKILFKNTGYIKKTSKHVLLYSGVEDPTIQLQGRGIFDTYPEHNKSDACVLWRSIFNRCYGNYSLKKSPSYKGCSVSEEWRLFSRFKKWYDNNYIDGWHLDKDLKVKGNKVYGEDFCIFVPQVLNSLTVNSTAIRGDLPVEVTACDSLTNPFKADIKFTEDGITKRKYLGCFPTKEEAFCAYLSAKLKVIEDKSLELYNKGIITEELLNIMLNYTISIDE